MVRILTYNVRHCLGTDGILSPARIAAVIEPCDPEIVALQEIDVGRARSDGVDQAGAIAERLGFENVHFNAALSLGDEKYGDAILSKYPSRLVHGGPLPGFARRPRLEARGALWVKVEVEGRTLNVINTHLGLRRAERLAQAKALLSKEWLAHPDCRTPVVLIGDFNSSPPGRTYRRLCARLADAQIAEGRTPQRTFPAQRPLLRIDHLFLSAQLSVSAIRTIRNQTTRLASDHLPPVADLAIVPCERQGHRPASIQ